MTTIGHILVSSSVAALCIPRFDSSKKKIIFYFVFIVLGSLPDLPIKSWGHQEYEISHSLFVLSTLIITGITFFCFWRRLLDQIGGLKVIIGGSLAILSHLLLDSMYNHGNGIAIFYPFGNGRLSLPIKCFSIVGGISNLLTFNTMKIVMIEILFFSPILLFSILIRKYFCKNKTN